MGLAPKVGNIRVFAIFCAAESFCLAATLVRLIRRRLAIGLSLPLEYFLDTAMSDEGNELYSQSHEDPAIPSRHSKTTANELALPLKTCEKTSRPSPPTRN